MIRWLLGIVLISIVWTNNCVAQQAGAVYTSPGNPLIVSGRPSKYTQAHQPEPRFWATKDSVAQQLQAQTFLRKVGGRLRLPAAFLRHSEAYTQAAPTTLRFSLNVLIRPDGGIASTTLLPITDEATATSSPPLLEILVNEAKRVMGTFRFAPGTTQDSIVVPISYFVD